MERAEDRLNELDRELSRLRSTVNSMKGDTGTFDQELHRIEHELNGLHTKYSVFADGTVTRIGQVASDANRTTLGLSERLVALSAEMEKRSDAMETRLKSLSLEITSPTQRPPEPDAKPKLGSLPVQVGAALATATAVAATMSVEEWGAFAAALKAFFGGFGSG